MNTTILATMLFLSPAVDLRSIGDAPLHCVRFVDRNEGWAAGSDGALWHTIDGGASWELQPTMTSGMIRALQFLTPYTGFAVAREEVQSTGGSAGILLSTRDGGLTWSRLAPGALPGIQSVAFFDENNGLAIGDGTDRWPGGLYRTNDGGRSWTPLPAARGGAWRSAHATDMNTAVLVGSWGRLGVLRDGVFAPADVDYPGARHVRSVSVAGKRAVAVGQGGLVLVSPDTAGVRYGFADLGLNANELESVDLRGVCCVGDHVWIVGSPGSIVFHSADGGTTWERISTGQSLPLNDVFFLDNLRGWAVGELGTILATSDGGKTWKVQRRGGQRAAVLCIHARGKDVPLDLIATLGGDSGYLVTTLGVTSADAVAASPVRATEDWRLQTATRKAGGASAEMLHGFPIPPQFETSDRDELTKHWNEKHSGRATEHLVAEFAMAIRMWQPEVVITDFAGSPAETLVVEAIRDAVAKAGDANAFPDQLKTWKLAPWSAKKLFGLWDGPGQPSTIVTTSEFARALGDSPREYAARVVGLVGERGTMPKQRGFRFLGGTAPPPGGSLMEGIRLAPGGTARRGAPDETGNAHDAIEKHLRELRTLQTVSVETTGVLGDPSAALGRIGPVLDKLPAEQASHAALLVADQYARMGQWQLAREAYGLAAKKYAKQPAGLEAMRWLVRYHSSGEARRREELKQNVSLMRAEFKASANIPTRNEPFRPGSGVRPLAETTTLRDKQPIFDPIAARRWYEPALELETQFASHGVQVANDPSIRFCLAAAKRQLGDADTGKEWLRKFLAEQAGQSVDDPWRMTARQELWLMERMGPAPRGAAVCRRTSERPHLDGKLEDPCWNAATPISLKHKSGSIDERYSTQARFAFDDEYLYMAVECKYPADTYRPPIETRHRDADVSSFDRVELMLDIDRDYQTYYRLRVDQRGALADDCWGDATWNPRWFVAFSSNNVGYTVEAAITLSDLSGDPLPTGKSWAMNLVRIVPGRGIQSWSTPADVQPRPDGCGVLMFQSDAK